MFDDILSTLSFVDIFNICVFITFTFCYAYQLFYVLVVLTRKAPKQTAKKNHRYAVLIAARNENAVIGDLIHSIRVQNYPQELIDIFVIADNCTDNTAAIAQEAGAIVFPRFNTEQIGKGYALDYGVTCIREHYSENEYEAYFVFDADNVLDVNYFREMNKVFDGGAIASTSYRNSKNFGSNWISAGYGVWFLREAKYLSQARLTLNTSCAVSGTGFFVSAKIIEKMGGWKFHLLTEDLEFTMDSVLHGDRIGYVGSAILYDEQPVTFAQSWRQRLRWSKGFLQVFRYYGPALVRRAIQERDFSSIDLTLFICPFTVLAIIRVLLGTIFAACGFISWSSQGAALFNWMLGVVSSMVFMMVLAGLTMVVERKQIGASNRELFAYALSFPIYILSYVPISFQAVFAKAQWKPIEHQGSSGAEDPRIREQDREERAMAS